ncbi:MAG: hypothetical protein EZS28_045009, partial [Streblomastix strix]
QKGGRAPVGSKATSTNTSVVANQNQNEDQQCRLPGAIPRRFHRNGIDKGTKDDIHKLEYFHCTLMEEQLQSLPNTVIRKGQKVIQRHGN